MKFRKQFFSVLALLALLWIGAGFIISSDAYTETVEENAVTAQSQAMQDAGEAGAAIGATIGLTIFLCTGLPFLLLFSLLAWRNGAGLKAEQRHQEMLAAQRGQR